MNRLQKKEAARLDQLLSTRRWCYVIPVEGFVEGHGYRVSIAIENVKGHYPTGDLETLSPVKKTRENAFFNGGSVPWFWGTDLEEAKRVCEHQNAKLGISSEDALKIVSSTMGGGR